ncbi:MAG TPA: endo-1,4-beta-xylanase [Candidatus Acidoferrum sp.]|nr:endo-1,4-beta-xylanase [Candidatus Acidoferrum sp.]
MPHQTLAKDPVASAGQPALKGAFKDAFHIGAALSVEQITGKEPDAIAQVTKHCSSITPENILKWEEVHPEPHRYNFDAPDQYVAFGEAHQMQIIGHTLVWHWQTPDWVFQDAAGKPLSREALLQRMKDHIFTVMGRYRGRIHAWDVVNEAIMADGSWRKSKWLEIIGEDYVLKAFEFARQADPQAELYYNEYDYEYRPKCEGVIRLVKNLQAKGARVDGVGIQGHWFLDFPRIDELEAYILKLAEVKVKLMITELDIGVLPFCHLDTPKKDLSAFDAETQKKLNPYPSGLPEAVSKAQARRYADLFSLFLKHRDKFSRVTFWGVHDAQTWRSYLPIGGRAEYPLLFDRQCRPKPALNAILKAAQGRN